MTLHWEYFAGTLAVSSWPSSCSGVSQSPRTSSSIFYIGNQSSPRTTVGTTWPDFADRRWDRYTPAVFPLLLVLLLATLGLWYWWALAQFQSTP